MDAAELDLEDLPPKALRKLIKSMLAKAGKAAGKEATDKADEEREALADLHEEHKGKASPIPVLKDDLPPEMEGDDGEDSADEPDDDADDADVKAAKKKGK